MQSTTALATHLGWDVADVRDCRYQQGHTRGLVFSVGEYYYTVCKVGKKPAKFDLEWEAVDSWITTPYQWLVFRAHMNGK